MATNFTKVTVFGLVNAYLVREEDGLTLIDTTIAGQAGKLLGAAEKLDQPIRRIVITHAHSDHVGSLDALHAKLPEAEIIISARDARLLKGDTSLDADEPKGRVIPGKAKTTPTRTVGEGDRVGSLQVFFTPGHSPGHISLLDERDQTVFCGDVYATVAGLHTSAKASPLFPLPAIATWHKPTELESARKVRGLHPARIAPGHGSVVESPGDKLDAAIARGA